MGVILNAEAGEDPISPDCPLKLEIAFHITHSKCKSQTTFLPFKPLSQRSQLAAVFGLDCHVLVRQGDPANPSFCSSTQSVAPTYLPLQSYEFASLPTFR